MAVKPVFTPDFIGTIKSTGPAVGYRPPVPEAVCDTGASPVTLCPPQYRIEQPLGLT